MTEEKQKSSLLEQIFSDLREQALRNNKPASKILKIKNADSIVLQINAVPNGSQVRFSMTIHRRNNYKKQIGITADDAQSLLAIANFLEKYSNYLNKYVRFSITNTRNNNNEIEIEQETEEEETRQQVERKKRNVEEEF
ncbi:hypothetical protein N617_gp04 [Stygiolobus rod-shaped virus]|uniref:PHA01746-like domain-containing protein n=1 Tax=Stygiolobus rod-shaped virus TaxID=537009 RepID=B6EFB0_9VIRU|nr:hypothetical protein N617_gp04 [Stygiolobus rod-shaped virus]CAQ58445.1 hypothetical protein [Stygiolobus rod-shaped virus]